MAGLNGEWTRRKAVLAGGAALALPYVSRAARAESEADSDRLFAELDAKILKGMGDFSIPGAAVAVVHGNRTHVRGYGVKTFGDNAPVDADTVFRIASNSKTFTGTAAMSLVDAGKIDLDRQVQFYVPDFVAPKAQCVTVRQALNHSAGWLGYDFHDTGSGVGALEQYVEDVRELPQLTPLGTTYSYNNAAISVAGRVIESVTRGTYESAVGRLVFDPLELNRSLFSQNKPTIGNVATPHDVQGSRAVPNARYFYLPRSNNPFGGVWSCARDQLAYLAFHLGDGCAGSGRRVMSEKALRAMRVPTGPGGAMFVELIGWGVSWMIRPTAENVPVVQHGGDLSGFHSGLIMVPERRFAMTLLTNSESGPELLAQLFIDDWALRRFAGVSNLPATPRKLTAAELKPYEGQYWAEQIPTRDDSGQCIPERIRFYIDLKAQDGALTMTKVDSGLPSTTLTFYKHDYVLVQGNGARANFLRAPDGSIEFFRIGGRLYTRAP